MLNPYWVFNDLSFGFSTILYALRANSGYWKANICGKNHNHGT
jgi:hypothetical protein